MLTIPYPNVIRRLVHFKRRLIGQSGLIDDDFYEITYTQHQLRAELGRPDLSCCWSSDQPQFHSVGAGLAVSRAGLLPHHPMAECLGACCGAVPWPFNFTTLLIARKVETWGAEGPTERHARLQIFLD